MIKLVNVSKYYHNEGVVSLGLRKINLEFNIGEFVAITGESGSGKSTLLNVISGIDTYEDGELYINGEETSYYDDEDWEEYRKNKVAFIFQNYNLIDSYSVLRNVETALVNQGYDLKTRRKKAIEILERVGLNKHLKHRASKLSGGEKQRLAIARALAKDSDLIVADEPTGNLDSASGKQVLALLNEVAKEKLVLIVTHNYEQAESYVTRKIRLFDGEVVEDKEIRPFSPQKPHEKTLNPMSELKKSAIVTLNNFFGQPRKSLLMLLVSLATVAFVFLIYGSLLNVGDGRGFYVRESFNAYPERVIVVRKDGEPLTDVDYQRLSKLPKIKRIIKEDAALDFNFTLGQSGINNYLYFGGFPAFIEKFDQKKLIGRIPKEEGEILLCTYVYEEYLNSVEGFLEKDIEFYISLNYFSLRKNYKLVGIYNNPEQAGKYVITEDELKNLYNYTRFSGDFTITIENSEDFFIHNFYRVFPDKKLTGNQVSSFDLNDYVNRDEYTLKWKDRVLIPVECQKESDYRIIYISPELFETIVPPEYPQYTLDLYKVSDAQSVLQSLYKEGYYGYSVHLSFNRQYQTIDDIIYKFFMRLILAFTLLVIYLLSYLIYRAILNSKIHDYTILRIIGFQKTNIRQIIFLEILTSFIFAYLFFVLVYQFIRLKYPIMDVYEFKDYLLVGIINFLLAVFITMRFIRYQKGKSLFSNLKVEV
ncbi:MAG TPA: ATP-binding cassette domain-containing protein [Acholeplasmataceae bacterium]|nr:ATP-binding cassette domain-containing protein [Acholeplasmataceae bacterium]